MISVEKARKLRAVIERSVSAAGLDDETALEAVELSRHGSRAGTTPPGHGYGIAGAFTSARPLTRRRRSGARPPPRRFGAR